MQDTVSYTFYYWLDEVNRGIGQGGKQDFNQDLKTSTQMTTQHHLQLGIVVHFNLCHLAKVPPSHTLHTSWQCLHTIYCTDRWMTFTFTVSHTPWHLHMLVKMGEAEFFFLPRWTMAFIFSEAYCNGRHDINAHNCHTLTSYKPLTKWGM